ncbi:ANL_HP_G0073840.mRNA.1.CDS.1 [Saccharomyces cerevisiae]|nr:ANL_HP_G0199440.mRNA.1.CDS.1 [Saccharomyces cerevisiae]CAI4994126.1 ANL_HP_G0050100.mRNA.1.CDS.1 [Saccharomyces cerevisiae]CAI4997203.1 ANL_HP_G0003060.mRNA.1.CDS.1 [Saccharomyces cerevisiae]CAI5023733.1 ANL_HP_G0073840.mRNA.1.CDS.1 [Saccharomyces cerevisiae]CAI6459906.1 ANL_HP_G0199440.mRNA.1.CDS.1 [Saccharomyces cerevisiae]
MSELGEYSKLENKELRTEFELTNFPFPGTTDNDSDDGSQGQNSLNIITPDMDDTLVNDVLRENDKKSSMRMAFMNLANSILGAGIITQPFAIKNAGILGGLLSYVALGFIVDWTLRLIVINLTLAGKRTYQGTVEHVMGKKGKLLILFTNGLFAFGGCIGYCIIIGDTIPHVLRAIFSQNDGNVHFWLRRNVIIVMVTTFISFPLSMKRNIEALSKASFLAVISMIIIVLTVVIRGPMLPYDWKGHSLKLSDFFMKATIFRSLSVISFAFPETDTAINIARLCFGFNMLTTFPMEIFVLRDVVGNLLHECNLIKNYDEHTQLSGKQHVVITSSLVFVTMGISLTTCNLGALFELIGATTASTMAYILPPYTNLLLTSKKKSWKEKLPFYLCICFGFMIMIISSTQTIIDAVNGSDGQHCQI